MWLGSTETGMFEIRLMGPGMEVLQRQAEQLMAALRDVSGSLDIKQDWDNPIIKMAVNVDQTRARRANIGSEEVANILGAFVFGFPITDYWAGDIDIPIVVRGVESERTSLTGLSSLQIYSQKNPKGVPLSQIATIKGVGEFSKIMRHNQERTVIVSAKHQILAASQIFERIKPVLDDIEFPAHHHWEMSCELEESAKAQTRLTKWFPFCFLMIIVLLVWQFNSFRRAGIILITIPLILIGAVIGMLV